MLYCYTPSALDAIILFSLLFGLPATLAYRKKNLETTLSWLIGIMFPIYIVMSIFAANCVK